MEFPLNGRIKQERQVYESGLDQNLKIGVQRLPHSFVLTDLTIGCVNPQPEISLHLFASSVSAIGQRQPIERRAVVHIIVYALRELKKSS
jgi:hypothetical protein